MNSIETERLIIREFTTEDLPKLIELRIKPEVYKYLGGEKLQNPAAIEKRLQFYINCYEEYGFGMFAVIWKETGEMIGWSGLQPLADTGEIEVGYGFAKEFWGKGLATESAKAWLDHGFNQANLKRIVAVAYPENESSWRVMEKLGMKYEKSEEHYGANCVFYAISSEEWKKN